MRTRNEALRPAVYLFALAACLEISDIRAQTTESSQELATIVVTAQKRAEDIQKVPVSMEVFTGRELENLGVQWTSDIGNVTSNVEIILPNGSGNQPLLVIRGIGLNDANSNNAGPNGMYMDEVYLSSPQSQSSQMFDLDRVEVLKGPQGTLYGRNTTGGAINLISAKPTDTPTGNLSFDYSSYNTDRLAGALGGPIAPGLDGRIAFVQNYSEGYMFNALNGQKNNGANDQAARAILLYKGIDNLSVEFNVHGSHVDTRPTEYRNYGAFLPGTQGSANPPVCSVGQVYAGDCVNVFGYGTPANFYSGSYDRTEHLKVTSVGSSLRADYAPGPITFTSISSFEHNQRFLPEDSDQSPNRILNIDWSVDSTAFTQEFRVAQNERKYNWVGGLYYLHEDLKQQQVLHFFLDFDQFGAFGIPPGPGAGDGQAFIFYDDAHQVTDAFAAFGQGEYQITDQLKVVLGARYTVEDRSFDYLGNIHYQEGGENNFGPLMTQADSQKSLRNSNVSWRTGLNYQPASDLLAYVSVATGFKSADFNGGFIMGTPEQVERLLAPASPEHVTTYETGFKAGFDNRRLIFNLSLFYNDYRDLQIYSLVPNPAGPLNVLDNAQKAHTEGADIEVTAKPFTGFTATLQLGLLSTRLDEFVKDRDPAQPDYTGNQLAYSPHTSGTITLDYKHPLGSGVLDLLYNAAYKSHQFYDSSNDPYIAQAAYWLQNARVGWTFGQAHWEAAAYGRNLGGTHYSVANFDGAIPFGFIQYIVGMPRTFGGVINYRF